MKMNLKIITLLALTGLLGTAFPVQAHRSGCHRWHSCPSDSGIYTCGDLGYPCRYPTYSTRSPSSPPPASSSSGSIIGTTSYVSDYILTYVDDIPAIVNQEFVKVFSRLPNDAESWYWKNRIRVGTVGQYGVRTTINTRSGLRAAMGWHKNNGSTGAAQPQIAGVQDKSLAMQINTLFREVYSRNPSPSENRYWLSRIADKPSAQTLKDAMAFHKTQGIAH